MTQRSALSLAAMAAAIAPALIAALLALSVGMLLNAFAVAGIHVLFFALPVYWVFRKLGWFNFVTTLIGGAVLGAVPFACVFYPRTYFNPGGYADFNGVRHYSNGVPTDAAWSSYFDSVIEFALFGIMGAIAFWLVLRHFGFTKREP